MSELPESPYALAWSMARVIAFQEKKPLAASGVPMGTEREYVLQLVKECLDVATKGSWLPHSRPGS